MHKNITIIFIVACLTIVLATALVIQMKGSLATTSTPCASINESSFVYIDNGILGALDATENTTLCILEPVNDGARWVEVRKFMSRVETEKRVQALKEMQVTE